LLYGTATGIVLAIMFGLSIFDVESS
jgi:hypothetical protein